MNEGRSFRSLYTPRLATVQRHVGVGGDVIVNVPVRHELEKQAVVSQAPGLDNAGVGPGYQASWPRSGPVPCLSFVGIFENCCIVDLAIATGPAAGVHDAYDTRRRRSILRKISVAWLVAAVGSNQSYQTAGLCPSEGERAKQRQAPKCPGGVPGSSCNLGCSQSCGRGEECEGGRKKANAWAISAEAVLLRLETSCRMFDLWPKAGLRRCATCRHAAFEKRAHVTNGSVAPQDIGQSIHQLTDNCQWTTNN